MLRAQRVVCDLVTMYKDGDEELIYACTTLLAKMTDVIYCPKMWTCNSFLTVITCTDQHALPNPMHYYDKTINN